MLKDLIGAAPSTPLGTLVTACVKREQAWEERAVAAPPPARDLQT